MAFNIAIDGPAGAGKSTIARRLAKELSYIYVDTGAMFRAMALYCIRNQIPAAEEEAVSKACEKISVSLSYADGEQQVLLNGENVNGAIRTEEVGNTASTISAYGKVREKLLDLQRSLAAQQEVVMDGRDIGTCVLPDAQVKIYLTASVETRGQRRFRELLENGASCNLEEICADIKDRDYRDMNRDIAPLKQAEDAVVIDSSHMTIEEVVNDILELVRQAKNKA